MRMWANKENTPRNNGGLDPILSQNRSRVFHLPIDGKVENIAITKSFVEPTGGEYFFAPSIGFFKNTLAGGTKKRVTEDVESFELRHRAEEGEEETEMVSSEVDNDDALPLPFDELLTLDGAEKGAAAEVEDEWPDPSTAP